MDDQGQTPRGPVLDELLQDTQAPYCALDEKDDMQVMSQGGLSFGSSLVGPLTPREIMGLFQHSIQQPLSQQQQQQLIHLQRSVQVQTPTGDQGQLPPGYTPRFGDDPNMMDLWMKDIMSDMKIEQSKSGQFSDMGVPSFDGMIPRSGGQNQRIEMNDRDEEEDEENTNKEEAMRAGEQVNLDEGLEVQLQNEFIDIALGEEGFPDQSMSDMNFAGMNIVSQFDQGEELTSKPSTQTVAAAAVPKPGLLDIERELIRNAYLEKQKAQSQAQQTLTPTRIASSYTHVVYPPTVQALPRIGDGASQHQGQIHQLPFHPGYMMQAQPISGYAQSYSQPVQSQKSAVMTVLPTYSSYPSNYSMATPSAPSPGYVNVSYTNLPPLAPSYVMVPAHVDTSRSGSGSTIGDQSTSGKIGVQSPTRIANAFAGSQKNTEGGVIVGGSEILDPRFDALSAVYSGSIESYETASNSTNSRLLEGSGQSVGSYPQNPAKAKKRYKRTTASKYCHICLRKESAVRMAVCSSINEGTCLKVICEVCFQKFGWNWEEATCENTTWTCTHCREECPDTARCRIYEKVNSNRREKAHARTTSHGSANAAASGPVPDSGKAQPVRANSLGMGISAASLFKSVSNHHSRRASSKHSSQTNSPTFALEAPKESSGIPVHPHVISPPPETPAAASGSAPGEPENRKRWSLPNFSAFKKSS